MGVLAFITVLYILIVVIYCCKGKKYKDDTESYQPKSSKVSKARTSSSSTKKVSEDNKAPKAFRAQDKTKGDSRTETEQ